MNRIRSLRHKVVDHFSVDSLNTATPLDLVGDIPEPAPPVPARIADGGRHGSTSVAASQGEY
jgi:hypothetical protein